MTFYDHAVIAFYFLFMLGMGAVTSRLVKNSSEYFRGGGKMMWWLVGASAFMTQFSAWSFTGAAAKAYTEGWPILVILIGNAFGFALAAKYFAGRARQMRVITAIEAVRDRFPGANEQVFTWLQIPLGTLYAGIWLNGLCVFLAAVFGLPLEPTILVTGIVVLLMTLFGGSWAAIAGDFVQMLVLMPVTVVAAFLALREVGGAGALLERLPDTHLRLSDVFTSPLLLVWSIAILIKQYINTNNLFDASRYLCVKDADHARKAALLAAVMFLVGPIVWLLPPLASRVLFPDLALQFPSLKNPAEGAFAALCLATMPAGMVGLLVSGMFSATMSSMDSGLNRNAGIFVKNFYQPVLRPAAGDGELVWTGRITTAVLGLLVILAGLWFNRMQDIGLFDLMLQFGSLVALPYVIPLVLGFWWHRTPPWSGWSTVLICFATSLLVTRIFTPEWAETTFGWATLNASDRSAWVVAVGVLANAAVGTLWFGATSWFWSRTAPADRARIEEFEHRSRQPIQFEAEIGETDSGNAQGRLLGNLSLAYGGFILLLALIPNPLSGRLTFVFCALLVLGIGALLRRGRRSSSA